MTIFASCSQSSAPPAPTTTNSAETEQTSGTKKDDSLGSADDELGDADGEVSSGTAFNYGGANIGDEEDKANVTKCHEEGKVYDRFLEAGATCSSLPLAKLDCTKSGIKAVLSDSQKASFEEKMSGSFDGWELDQCGDCPEDSDNALCKSTTGGKQTGTKVFFVTEEGDEIKGKALVLPVRPNGSQGSDGSGAGSGSGTGTGLGSGTGTGEGTGTDDPFALTH